MRRRLFFLVLGLLAALAAPAAADIIHLKNGGRIEGTVLSEEGGKVRVRTKFGVQTIDRSLIDRIEKKKTPYEEYLERRAALDPGDADGHFELARFCREHGLRKEEAELYRETLKIDPQHDGANEAVGNVRYEGEWMTPKERDRRKKAAEEAEMRARGLVRYRGRWVTPEEKENLSKGLVKYRGRWMTPDQVKEAQGFVKYKGKWVRKEDLEKIRIAATYEEMSGVKMNVVLSEHFAAVGPYEPGELATLTEGAEQCYEQFVEIFGLGPTEDLLRGAEEDTGRKRCHLVYVQKAFDYSRLVDGFSKKYPKDIAGDRAKLMKVQKGFYFVYPACYVVGYQFPNPFEQVRASVIHKVSHVLLMRYRYTSGFYPWWLIEGLGTFQEISALGHCDTYCVTTGGYGMQEGGAKRKWAGLNRWKEVAKAQVVGLADRSLIQLGRLGLNQLDYRDLAKCWSLCEWMINRHREEFVKLVKLLKKKRKLREAVQEAFGKPAEQIDKEWRDYVRANY